MKDANIVTIYDLENKGAPLECHRIDANEFLRFPRWSATPTVAEPREAPVKGPEPSGQETATDPYELTVAQIKDALAERGVDIPAGVTKKADLQALLDGAK